MLLLPPPSPEPGESERDIHVCCQYTQTSPRSLDPSATLGGPPSGRPPSLRSGAGWERSVSGTCGQVRAREWWWWWWLVGDLDMPALVP